eukprot:Skav226341  [mRNA]  locus=scaffold3640:86953:89090:+ [translate_table: standard]
MAALFEDLKWAHEVDEGIPAHWSQDLTDAIESWQTPTTPSWKRTIQRIWRRHLQQEELMTHAHSLHKTIFRALVTGGAEFQPPLDTMWQLGTEKTASFPCHCGRMFTTKQGLACHQRLVHDAEGLEKKFLCGSTCPSCLRHFWTTNRLRMHLSYMPRDGSPNICYNNLLQLGYSTDYEVAHLPRQHLGQARCDALQAQGPARDPTPATDRALLLLRQQETALEQELRAPSLDRHWEDGLRLDLGDSWIALMADYDPQDADWVAFVFIEWGRRWLPDIVEEFVDGFVETYVLEEFNTLMNALPQIHTEEQLSLVQARIRYFESLPIPGPHRPVRRGPANTSERMRAVAVVPRLLRDQVDWQARLRQVVWHTTPRADLIPMVQIGDASPMFLIVHLFAGRRRVGDMHCHLTRLAQEGQMPVLILSLDTAISPVLGDLTSTSDTWQKLTELYSEGMVSATMLGSPCETFSSARHQPPPDDIPVSSWPRPLRSATKIYGLDHLRPKEYRQLRTGTAFWLQGLQTAANVLVHGGLWLSEHPAPPKDPSHASTWSAAITELIRAHPDAHLRLVMQYKWGASVPKPTGLLGIRLPKLIQDLHTRADDSATYPVDVAIGRDPSNGEFRTAKHKEYPERFCAGLSFAVFSQLKRAQQSGTVRVTHLKAGGALHAWIMEVADVSKKIRDVSWLPDFQG